MESKILPLLWLKLVNRAESGDKWVFLFCTPESQGITRLLQTLLDWGMVSCREDSAPGKLEI